MKSTIRYYSARLRKALKLVRNLSGIMEVPSVSNFGELQRRIIACYPEKSRKPRILLVTSNGAGLGHLTRLSAVSRYLESETLIYTMSSAYKKIGRDPDTIIYFPSYGDLGMDGSIWNRFMQAHLEATIDAFNPTLVVFDGTFVYRGVTGSCRNFGVPLVWLQRGAWKTDVDKRSRQRHNAIKYCDRVVIPKDYGVVEKVDCGPEIEVNYVNPIVLGEQSEILSKEMAREVLDIPDGKKPVLIQLGAGRINSIESALEAAVVAVGDLGPDWLPVVVNNPLSHGKIAESVHSISYYPLSRVFNAFEFGVFAAGYNSVQESVAFGLPGVFLPNEFTKTDDQVARARGLEAAGLGICAMSTSALRQGISALAEVKYRESIAQRMSFARSANGAPETARYLEALVSAETLESNTRSQNE